MKKINLFTVVFVVVFASCKKTSEEKNLNKFMLGSWQTEYIKIEMATVNKTDSLQVFEDDFSKQNSGRAQSMYKKDGTFSAWFLQPDGKRVGETVGNWKTKGDSLFVDYPYVGKQVQAWYHIKQKENGFEGTVIYDWDNDGEFDDTLFMKTKRIDLK